VRRGDFGSSGVLSTRHRKEEARLISALRKVRVLLPGSLDLELTVVVGPVSKAGGARKGVRCEPSEIRLNGV